MALDDAKQKLSQLAACQPVEITYEGAITAGRDPPNPAPWNQAMIAVVKEEDSLLWAHRRARSVFLGVSEDEPVSWAPPIGKPHLSLAYVESTPEDDRSRRLLSEFAQPPCLPAPFLASDAILAAVSFPKKGAASVWPACQHGLWREVARVSLVG